MSVSVLVNTSSAVSSNHDSTCIVTSTAAIADGDHVPLDRKVLFDSWPQRSAHVIEELIVTERNYVESLNEIIDGYLKPLYEFLLQQSQGPDFIQIVFCNIKKLHNIHQKLFNNFLLLYNRPEEFAATFEQNIEGFKEYIHYCTNFPNCEHTLQNTLKNNPTTQEFIIKCQMELGHPLPLITYLHKPVQRILKYKLLLEQVLKGFSNNTIGYKELQNALSTMSNIAIEINEVKKKQENLKRVESIEKQLKGLKGSEISDKSLQSYGQLILEEECKVLGRKGGERVLLLFEKMLLFLKKKVDSSYVYKGLIMIEELDLWDEPRRGNILKLFSICSTSKKFLVELRSKRVKEEMIGRIQELLVSQIDRKKAEDTTENLENENDPPQTKMSNNLAYQRSLVAKDLQHRRKKRQTSTKKFTSMEGAENNQEHMEAEEQGHRIVKSPDDSGISVGSDTSSLSQTTTKDIEEQSSKLKRKIAFRRKKLHTVTTPELQAARNKFNSTRSVRTATVTELDEDVSVLEFESSLDKIPNCSREDVLSENSIENYIYPEDYHHPRKFSLPVFRSRADVYPTPPDPCEILGKDKLSTTTASFDEEMLPPLSEQDEKLFEELVNRRSIYSRYFEDSLGSNESSLCLEDHYLLSRTHKSTVIAGKDGENIVIFDDSDDSDSEDIISDDEENEREMVSTQRDMKTEGDVVQSSLRSYISMAKLYCPDHLSFDSNQMNNTISPLATLPRGVKSKGLLAPLMTSSQRKKSPLHKQITIDVIQSLPLGTLSASSTSIASNDSTNDITTGTAITTDDVNTGTAITTDDVNTGTAMTTDDVNTGTAMTTDDVNTGTAITTDDVNTGTAITTDDVNTGTAMTTDDITTGTAMTTDDITTGTAMTTDDITTGTAMTTDDITTGTAMTTDDVNTGTAITTDDITTGTAMTTDDITTGTAMTTDDITTGTAMTTDDVNTGTAITTDDITTGTAMTTDDVTTGTAMTTDDITTGTAMTTDDVNTGTAMTTDDITTGTAMTTDDITTGTAMTTDDITTGTAMTTDDITTGTAMTTDDVNTGTAITTDDITTGTAMTTDDITTGTAITTDDITTGTAMTTDDVTTGTAMTTDDITTGTAITTDDITTGTAMTTDDITTGTAMTTDDVNTGTAMTTDDITTGTAITTDDITTGTAMTTDDITTGTAMTTDDVNTGTAMTTDDITTGTAMTTDDVNTGTAITTDDITTGTAMTTDDITTGTAMTTDDVNTGTAMTTDDITTGTAMTTDDITTGTAITTDDVNTGTAITTDDVNTGTAITTDDVNTGTAITTDDITTGTAITPVVGSTVFEELTTVDQSLPYLLTNDNLINEDVNNEMPSLSPEVFDDLSILIDEPLAEDMEVERILPSGTNMYNQYRSASVPPYCPSTRPVYHHWTPSPPPMSHDNMAHNVVIDMSDILTLNSSENVNVSEELHYLSSVKESELRLRVGGGTSSVTTNTIYGKDNISVQNSAHDLIRQWRHLLTLTGGFLMGYISLQKLLISCLLIVLLLIIIYWYIMY